MSPESLLARMYLESHIHIILVCSRYQLVNYLVRSSAVFQKLEEPLKNSPDGLISSYGRLRLSFSRLLWRARSLLAPVFLQPEHLRSV